MPGEHPIVGHANGVSKRPLAPIGGPTGEACPEPEGSGGEQEVLHRREDRTTKKELRSGRVSLLGEQDGSELSGSIMQLVGGAVGAGPATVIVIGGARHAVHRLNHIQRLGRSLGHYCPLFRGPEDDEAPCLGVRARWGPGRGFEAPGEGGIVDRVIGEATDRPGGRHHGPDIVGGLAHTASPSLRSRLWARKSAPRFMERLYLAMTTPLHPGSDWTTH